MNGNYYELTISSENKELLEKFQNGELGDWTPSDIAAVVDMTEPIVEWCAHGTRLQDEICEQGCKRSEEVTHG